MEIEIGEETIRLGQLLKFANLVADGAEAKTLIIDGAVRVDGEVETRRGRQVGIGSTVEIDLRQGRQELLVVHPGGRGRLLRPTLRDSRSDGHTEPAGDR
ncbi:ribosome-associated protein YbcJ (S4-like RNA binding protein) [Propionicimonas paludicola]|uniref:Ribosome-associated protein YbcJ (S4-like RNA binding protein) n=1 Tax=Propionicimonas paludicola TaxID=185243 RepID=A0A2A9CUG0_9ACTN|nr:ribosome-associated protein YbcJ (S4-like RNA binding protein) [Propionicimonas paludicola]